MLARKEQTKGNPMIKRDVDNVIHVISSQCPPSRHPLTVVKLGGGNRQFNI